MKNILPVIALMACSAQASDVIKMSKSKICHDESSPSYNRTKNFTPYTSMEACLEAGGRLPKNQHKARPKHNTNPKQTKGHKAYARSAFGYGWADADRDCQNTRAEILIQQSVGLVSYKSQDECRVVKGKWNSLFTGKTLYEASKVDVDHIVPLKWAWEHGAAHWAKTMRVQFANDPVNLVSVEAALNRQKGAKGPDEWLPPKNRCQYISRFQRIVNKYRLKLRTAEVKSFQLLVKQYCKSD